MKTKKETKPTVVRSKYTAQFKEQALARSDLDGVPKVAKELGLAESIWYNWRAQRRQTGQSFEEQKLQQAELSRLKRDNARLEEAVAFLKKAGWRFNRSLQHFSKFIGRRGEAQGLPGTLVQAQGDAVQIRLGVNGQVPSLGEVLA